MAPLFAEEIAAEQSTPEERVDRLDENFVAWCRENRRWQAAKWWQARRELRALPEGARNFLLATWNQSSIPGNPCYLLDHIHTYPATVAQAIAAGERWYACLVEHTRIVLLWHPDCKAQPKTVLAGPCETLEELQERLKQVK